MLIRAPAFSSPFWTIMCNKQTAQELRQIILHRRMSNTAQAMPVAEERHLMFVYGTLKEGQPNHPHLVSAETGGIERVGKGHTREKYPLVIAGKYNIPYLLYKPGDGHQIHGEIYKVDTQKRDVLDDFESHPTYYERMEDDIVVTDGGETGEEKTLKCWVYFMKNYKPEMLQLTRYENYDSFGPHGLTYVESEETEDLSDV
ncbi:gamma-glutamylaminecyclotransferase-like isoform X2 [Babylonia areolata]|uniref:gamma-glutamylaminecyclotransferase-like isoform X2 n=1 Tax=Babylonia areolata TaxID=304850 RepID=UPI003FD63C7A